MMKKKSKSHDDFKAEFLERVCPICGKTFIPAPEHVYKTPTRDGHLVCSFSCDLLAMRRHHAKQRAKNKPLHIESINDEKWALATDSGVVIDVYYSQDDAQAALDSYNKNKKQ
jgi:hypothetical protein